ncbi:MAG: sigma 54-interacting transcriptional regulator [Myxococcota bacterium]
MNATRSPADFSVLARLAGERERILRAWLAAWHRATGDRGALRDDDLRALFGAEIDALAGARDADAVAVACRATAGALTARGAALADALLAASFLEEAAVEVLGDDVAAALRAVSALRARVWADAWLARPTGHGRRCVPMGAGPAPHARLDDELGIVGRSPAIEQLRLDVVHAARGGRCVLVTGEPGSGKDVVARAIHAASGARGPFVVARCAAIPRHGVEAELFGGPSSRGLFRDAEGGTLYLDEVTALGMDIQARLVHAIEARAVRPVGAVAAIPVRARVVAATGRPVAPAVAEGRLRADLAELLGVVTVAVPPLRDHKEDIPLLVEHFLGSFCSRRSGCVAGVSPAASRALARAEWPGNVRELRGVVEHAVTSGGGDLIGVDDLPPQVRGSEDEPKPEAAGGLPTLAEAEARLIRLALARHRGNKLAAARALGISRHKLYDKLRILEG